MLRFVLAGRLGANPLRFQLQSGLHVVGRSSDCAVHLADNAVSRRHAEVELENDRVILRDLGSMNGTYVNGNRLEGETELKPGDQVRIGHANLVLQGQETTDLARFAPEGTMVTMTTSVREIREESTKKRSEAVLAAVHEAGQLLSRPTGEQELYEGMLDLLERFIRASRVILMAAGEHGVIGEPLAARVHGASPDEPLRMSLTMLKQVLNEGRSFLTADAAQDFSPTASIVSAGIQGAMGAPLFDNDRVLGAIYVDSRIPGVTYTADDLRLLTLLANMTAVKMTNIRLEESERERERLQQELGIAARIQQNLLPHDITSPPGYSVFTHQTPCYEVGGDLFDVRACPQGRLWIVLGDISGKGIGAALLMSSVMASLQILEDECGDPLDLVTRLERHLEAHVEPGQFLTLFAGILEPAEGRLRYVNAGHCPPLILDEDGVRTLEPTGTPVALIAGMTRTEEETVLAKGSSLLVFSDGIPETENPTGAQYDEGQMQAFFDAACSRRDVDTPDSLADALLADVSSFRGESHARDDLTLVVLKRG